MPVNLTLYWLNLGLEIGGFITFSIFFLHNLLRRWVIEDFDVHLVPTQSQSTTLAQTSPDSNVFSFICIICSYLITDRSTLMFLSFIYRHKIHFNMIFSHDIFLNAIFIVLLALQWLITYICSYFQFNKCFYELFLSQ